MAKSTRGGSGKGGSTKGDGGRKPPTITPKPQQPGKSRANEGAPGIKPPKGKGS